ncbi:hypothetical protein DITRI_Ditri07aG0120900 [Diplodiscus trichospermus]
MLTFFASCFHRVLSGGILEVVESKRDSKFVSRDELIKKKCPSKQKSYCGDYSFSSTQVPLLKVRDENDIKGSSDGFDGKTSTTVRVKVKMTKQEAARLLSKCKDGGILEFRDVARELVNLPMDRVRLVSPCPGSNNGVLDSIPEDYN